MTERSYSRTTFNAEPMVQRLVHICLFAQTNVRFQYALENYCFHWFVHKALGEDGGAAEHPDWFEFFYFPETDGASVDPDISEELLTSDDPTRSVAAFVAWALVWHHNLMDKPGGGHLWWATQQVDQLIGATPEGHTAGSGRISAHDLMSSLHRDKIQDQGQSIFKRFNKFVINVLNSASDRAREMNGDPKFFYTPPGKIPITRAGGLDARSIFHMCFKIFRQVFIRHQSGDGIDKTHPRILEAFLPPSHASLDHNDIAAIVTAGDAYWAMTPSWVFFIPHTWSWRATNAIEAVDALTPGSQTLFTFHNAGIESEFTLFTDARATTDLQLRKMITALSQLGTIRRGIHEARIKVGSATAGAHPNPIIKEFFPRDGTPAQIERGTAMFSRFGEGHMVNVYRNAARMLPFLDFDQGEALPNTSQRALLPYYRRIGGTMTNPNGGRAKMLRSLLVNDPKFSVSEDNIFDPTNAKIMCMGLPAGGVRALHTSSTPLNDDDIERGLSAALTTELTRDNSLLGVSINKTDALLPGITYEDVAFYYDPRLYVAPDGFDECGAGTPLIDQLHKVKFRRVNVQDDGSVTEGVCGVGGSDGITFAPAYEDDVGFTGTCGSLGDTPPETAKQIAYVTARSDLLNLYVSLVNGIELGEESFHIVEGLMDQRIDSHMTEHSYNSIDIVPPIPRIADFPFPNMGSSGDLEGMINWNEELYGDFGTFRVKTLSRLTGIESDIPEASLVYSQQFLSSLLFKPHVTRAEILYPRRFDGMLFFLVDPDMFIVADFDPDEDKQIPTRDLLVEANLAKEDPPDADTYYVIKSGDNEDAAGVIELTVTFVPAPPATARAVLSGIMLQGLGP